jgi:hypothetical protein
MMLDVEIDATGPAALLDDMLGRLDNPRAGLAMLGRSLEEYERDVFGTRGRGTWEPLDADTLEQKAGGSIMRETGLLFRELTRARIVGTDAVQVDAGRAFYARFHRDGDRGMPRRNPAPAPTTAHVERWADQFVGWVVTGRDR